LSRVDTVSTSELAALEEEARTRLDRAAYDYIAGAAEEGIDHARQRGGLVALAIRPHVLRDVSTVDTSTRLSGRPWRRPSWWPRRHARTRLRRRRSGYGAGGGELRHDHDAVARGTSRSRRSRPSLRPAPLVPDLPSPRPRLYAGARQRARDAGYRAIVLTVDSPVLSRRARDIHNAFAPPAHLRVPNMPTPLRAMPRTPISWRWPPRSIRR